MQLKVWWIPQVPMKAYEVEVSNLVEAKLILEVLAGYDEFQYKNNIKPDYANVGGLVIFENGQWNDWLDEECNSIDELTLDELRDLAIDKS